MGYEMADKCLICETKLTDGNVVEYEGFDVCMECEDVVREEKEDLIDRLTYWSNRERRLFQIDDPSDEELEELAFVSDEVWSIENDLVAYEKNDTKEVD